jgi:hypothetical protein
VLREGLGKLQFLAVNGQELPVFNIVDVGLPQYDGLLTGR